MCVYSFQLTQDLHGLYFRYFHWSSLHYTYHAALARTQKDLGAWKSNSACLKNSNSVKDQTKSSPAQFNPVTTSPAYSGKVPLHHAQQECIFSPYDVVKNVSKNKLA